MFTAITDPTRPVSAIAPAAIGGTAHFAPHPQRGNQPGALGTHFTRGSSRLLREARRPFQRAGPGLNGSARLHAPAAGRHRTFHQSRR